MSGRITLDAPQQTPSPPEPPQKPVQAPEPAPPPPPPAPPPEPPQAPPGAADEAHGEATPKKEPPSDWEQRIDRLTREKYEARRQADELRRQWEQVQVQQRAAQAPAGGDAEERALQRLRQEQGEARFNEACNDVFRKGQADYQDFPDAVQRLNAVGWGNRPDALAAIASMPEGHHVYRALAQDLDNAARVLNLAPMHMAMELARMANASPRSDPATAPPQLTRAPAPLRPVGGNSARPEKPLNDPGVSMSEWIRRRDRDTQGSSRIRR